MRLIDADALRKVHCEDCNHEAQEMCKSDPVCATLMWLDEAPTIEAEPVKHGRWTLLRLSPIKKMVVCSACGGNFYTDLSTEDVFFNFCPNCGAKMD